MKEILNDIREKTEGMSRQDKVSYILTYYWYHMLIIFSVLALIVIFIVHYATYKKPEFTCVMVNQQIDTQRDNQMTDEFAKFSKIDPKRVEINSNYNFSYGDLKLDSSVYQVWEEERKVELTQKEFELLREFLLNQGRVLTRNQLLDAVWGTDYFGEDRIVDTHIKNLRKKLTGDYIDTIRGVGYRIDKVHKK